MKIRTILLSAVAAGASLGLAQAALAQSAPSSAPADTGSQIETVTVTGFVSKGAITATKLDIPVRDVPLSVSSYTGSFMKAIQTTNIADLYQYMTGVERAGNTGYDMVIRGFKTGGNDRNAIMTDGLPGLTVRFGSPPTIGVDHVELVKGAASILYGQEQPGGFVNVITKKPQDLFAGEIKVIGTAEQARSGENWGIDTAGDVTGPIDKDGKFLYRLIGEIGYVKHFRDYSYERPVYLAPSFAWNIDDSTQLLLQFEYRHTMTNYDTYLVTPSNDITKVQDIYTLYNQPNGWQRETGKTATVTFTHEFSHNIAWTVHYRHVTHQDSARGFDVVKFWPGNTSLERRARGQLNYRHYDFGDTYVTVPFDLGFVSNKMVVGAQIGEEVDDFKRLQFYNAPQAPNPLNADIAFVNPDYSTALPLSSYPLGPLNDRITNYVEKGVYFSDLMTFTKQFKAMVGLRYASQYQSQLTLTPGKPNNTTQSNNQTWLPMGGLIYQPNDDLSFYASYSSSYVPQASSAQDIYGNNTFAPIEASGYEVGTKDTFWDRKANVTMALFKIDESNVLNSFSCATVPGATATGTCSEAIGKEQSQGVEVELNIHPLPSWQILAGYAYTDATVSATNIANQLHAQLADVPTHDFHVWTRYDIPSGALMGFGVGGGITYISDRNGTLPTATSTKVLDMPGYTLVDAALYYIYDDNYDLTFKISNLFDERYYASAGAQGQYTILPGTPRAFTLAVTAHF